MDTSNYLKKNLVAWNTKVDIHVQSEFYSNEKFLAGDNTLKEIELALLGDVRGKKILHLQCHFGQDTISLARMGAHVTGVDFSDKAIAMATKMTNDLYVDAQFICCDLYDLPKHLNETFDIVFTSYGTVGWLPDMIKWASIVSRYLRNDGQFIFAEFHPVLWMLDNQQEEIQYAYFKEDEIIDTEDGSYADRKIDVKIETITWNHSIAEVLQPLLQENMELLDFQEYNYSPYAILHESIEIAPSKFQIKRYGNKIPLVYSLKMRKK
jgi:ubiquinone/menaquinone biosynthesis C-methylase UbiE